MCNEYPLKPHFYIVKLGYAGVYLFSYFCSKTETARRFKRVPTIYVLSKNKKNIKHFLLKIFNFYNLGKIYILDGRVFVMDCTKCKELL